MRTRDGCLLATWKKRQWKAEGIISSSLNVAARATAGPRLRRASFPIAGCKLRMRPGACFCEAELQRRLKS